MNQMTTQNLSFQIIVSAGETIRMVLPVNAVRTRHGNIKRWPAYSRVSPEIGQQMADQLSRTTKHGK